MARRFINLVMLLLVASWGSGMARALHEWTAHAEPAPTVSQAPLASADADASLPAWHSHDLEHHDECLTCQQLAIGMAAMLIAVFMVLVGQALAQSCVRHAQLIASASAFLPALPNRGPPAAIA